MRLCFDDDQRKIKWKKNKRRQTFSYKIFLESTRTLYVLLSSGKVRNSRLASVYVCVCVYAPAESYLNFKLHSQRTLNKPYLIGRTDSLCSTFRLLNSFTMWLPDGFLNYRNFIFARLCPFDMLSRIVYLPEYLAQFHLETF